MSDKGSAESAAGAGRPLAKVDVRERGAERDGEAQTMDRRLFMQLLAFRSPRGADPAAYRGALVSILQQDGLPAVVYDDVNDPRGLAVLSWSEDPTHFVQRLRPLFGREPLRELELRPELTMFGRSYSSGFEPNLEWWLLERPKETALNEQWPWAVWYPLRRSGAFEQLDPKEQGSILREHGVIGRAYADKDYAHDIRLACHGLDPNDNEFVIGLVGKELHPLSHIVQTMRKTRQTSEFIQQMGPFFVGYAAWRSAGS